ncbi:MAG: RND family transporter, partial [Calditrichaeota bacterium]
NDLVRSIVISDDFTLTALFISLNKQASDEKLFQNILDLLEKYPGSEKVYFGGLPYLRLQISRDIRQDLSRLMTIGLILMLAFLYFSLKQLRGVLLPFLVVIMSLIASLGLLPLLGWQVSIPTILLPVMMIAIANDYGIHLVARFQEDHVPPFRYSKKELAQRMFSTLFAPVLLTGLTTIVGMLCLLTHLLIPAKQMGILAAWGVFFALSASLLLLPALTSFLPLPRPVVKENRAHKPRMEKLLFSTGQFITQHPRAIVGVAGLVTGAAAIGLLFIQVDSNADHYYRPHHPVVKASQLINSHFGGSQTISLVMSGDIMNPDLLTKIDEYEKRLSALPQIGATMSIAKVTRQMTRVLNDPGDSLYDAIPSDRNAIAQYFELYAMSGDPTDLEKLVDFPFENAQIVTRINTSSTPELKRLVKKIEKMTAGDPSVTQIGGWGLIFSELADLLVKGQLLSLIYAIVLVSALMMLLFRSIAAGLLSALPLLVSIVVLFGLMGFFNIELNIATTMLSSIMIGIGIDYTIHFLWRYKVERQSGLDYHQAVIRTLLTSGRGITFNAFSVIIGFSALMFSSFMPVRFFGFLIFISILVCFLGALLLMPAVVVLLRPKFLEPSFNRSVNTMAFMNTKK